MISWIYPSPKMHEIGKWTFVVWDSPSLRMFHVILVVTWILGSGVDPNDILSCFWEVKISAILPRSPSKMICQTLRCTNIKMWWLSIPKTWLLSWPKTCNKLMSNMDSWQRLSNSFCVFCTNKHHFQHLYFFKHKHISLPFPHFFPQKTPRGFLNFRSSHWAREFVRTFHGQTLTRHFKGNGPLGVMKGLLSLMDIIRLLCQLLCVNSYINCDLL